MPAEVIHIADAATGSSAALIVSLGFNCFSWRPTLADGPREMLWAPAEFAGGEQRPSSGGIPLLFPFPGRIGAARFEFEGRSYELPPGDSHGNALHGFAFDRAWRTVDTQPDSVTAEFQLSVDAPEMCNSWPSDFSLSVRYSIDGTQLVMDAEYANRGEGNLPCGFGTHAYFRVPLADGGTSAETIIRAPVDRQWSLENMLPTGQPHEVDKETPLLAGVVLGSHEYDTVYQVAPGTKPIVTEVHDPTSGRIVRQTTDESFGCCVIYTPPHRDAVCLEPYTCMPDPFRLESEGHATGLQILAPGEKRSTRILLEVIDG